MLRRQLLDIEKVNLNYVEAYTELELIIKFIKEYNANVERLNYNFKVIEEVVPNVDDGVL